MCINCSTKYLLSSNRFLIIEPNGSLTIKIALFKGCYFDIFSFIKSAKKGQKSILRYFALEPIYLFPECFLKEITELSKGKFLDNSVIFSSIVFDWFI